MNQQDLVKYLDRYNQRYAQYGYDPKTLGWGGGKERQWLRFKILTEIGIRENDSVLDVGCGFADLYGYLTENGWSGKYLGVDINPTLLESGRRQYPGVELRQADILCDSVENKFDWVIESGIFNAKLEYEHNLKYIENMMSRMFDLSVKGIACDFMSTYVDFQHPDAYHTDPSDVIRIGKRIGAGVIVRMDYLPYEFAVYFKK